MNIDMLVFGEDWGGHPSSTQHLIKHLLPEREILWVNSLGLRRPRLTRRDMQRAWKKLIASLHSPASINKTHLISPRCQPEQVNPITLPFPASHIARTLNQALLKKKLLPILADTKTKPLLWTSLPSAVDVVGHMGERAAIYYCGDDFSALDGVDHEPIQAMEQELASKCQLIITASNKLAEKFPCHKTFVLPHGVDIALFNTPAPRALDLPAGKVAGFYGAIQGWFDQALFINLARILPDWEFILIGPANADISALTAEPNIQWLGAKPHHELPRYSQHWDVGLLPFINNAQIQACNPLKLREYLAAGSPVVSTDFPALDGYRDLIKVRNDAEGFANAILEIQQYKYHKQLLRETRQNRVKREGWEGRAKELLEVIRHL
jgi:glycosyltransferase involved in cell wall biosynthesis